MALATPGRARPPGERPGSHDLHCLQDPFRLHVIPPEGGRNDPHVGQWEASGAHDVGVPVTPLVQVGVVVAHGGAGVEAGFRF